jgi:3-phenylpropionate/cinnamic acid dioxygenase small subunit
MSDLEDHLALVGLTHQYAWALDSRNWPMFNDCFTDDGVIKVEPVGSSMPISEHDDFAGPRFAKLDGTRHLTANHVTEIEGDEATCRCYILAHHWINGVDVEYTVEGFYVDRCRRTEQGWKIFERTLHMMRKIGSYEELVAAGDVR